MKVICQQCNATYAINDAAIPPKGARAQCPRCKHLQQVKRPDADGAAPPAAAAPAVPAAAAAAGAPDPFADLDLGAPPPPPARPAAPATVARPAVRPSAPAAPGDPFANLDLGGGAAPPPPAAARGAPAAAADPFANLDLGGGGAPPPPPAARAAPPRPNSDPFANLDLGGGAPPPPPPAAARPAAPAAPRPDSDPFANLDIGGGARPPPAAPAPAAPAGPQALGKCNTCGKLIYDPFDAALGTCESCRSKQTGETSGDVAAPPPAALPPVPTLDVKPAPRVAERSREVSQPTSRPSPPRNWTPLILVMVGLTAVGVGGFAVYRVKPAFLFPPKDTGPAIPAPLATRVETAWALAFPDVSGTVSAHIDSARQHMALDKITEYRLAENEYKKAAVLALQAKDAQGLGRAAAGVVEAYLLGRGEFREKAADAEMADAMDGALQLAPGLDSVQRAHAYYLLRDGHAHLDEARGAAQKAFDSASLDGKAEALLALGSTYLDSAQRAYDFLDRALQSDPKLRRAYYYRGLAAERVGHYSKAIADFRKRLEIDPDAQRSLLEIARVYVTVGDVQNAKVALSQIISKDPYAFEAKLMMAIIGYQLDHGDKVADAQLEAMINSDTKPKQPVLLAALAHQATIAREKGDFKRAADRIDKALQIDDHYAPALYQRALAAVASNRPKDAEAAMTRLLEAPPDGVALDALQGRVAFALDHAADGAAHFRDALAKNPQDLRSALLGASLASRAGRSEDAYQLMTKAVEIDPNVDQRHRSISDYYESRKAELSGIAGGFDKEDHSLAQPIAYSGVLRYYAGDTGGAEAKLTEATQLEPGCVPALVYLSELSLEKKKFAKAQTFAEQALDAERLSAIGKYLLAESDEALGATEDARRLYSETLAQAPGFTGAMLHEGELLAKANKVDDAEAMLLKVFFADPDDTEACSVLFKLGY